jgi:hypothetical protein
MSDKRALIGGVLVVACACLVAGLGSSPVPIAPAAPVRPASLAIPAAPGGPILVVIPQTGFGRYVPELLRAEGLDAFATATPAAGLRTATLREHDTVVLAPGDVTRAQARTLARWVRSGGRLVALRPPARLAALLGLRRRGGTLDEGYLAIDTRTAPGRGLTAATMQYHGAADRYALVRGAGARAVATLYADATARTSAPAVTLRRVGTRGGQAAAFTYDLPRSVVQTRQGNPAWAGTERDGDPDGVIRADDLFLGAKDGDRRADWVDLDKVAIPQADEQQRLLANLLTRMARTPLPRFWYLPHGYAAAVVLTGDDHGDGGSGSVARFRQNLGQSPHDCSVKDWTCVRSTSYAFPTSRMSDRVLRRYQAAGFELALHTRVDAPAAHGTDSDESGKCNNFDSAGQLQAEMAEQLAALRRELPSLDAPLTNRMHCVIWSSWTGTAEAESARHMGLDTTYYYWPANWVADRPGVFTGSALPMRFAAADGSLLDVYQAATQVTDESGQAIGPTVDALLDAATGPQGAYGVYTVNVHTDASNATAHRDADAVVRSAQDHGVPVISARQLLTWLVGRDRSAFTGVRYAAGRLTFRVRQGPGAHGLQAMLPIDAGGVGTAFRGLSCDGRAVATALKAVKGIDYAFFTPRPGRCVATYGRRVD